MRYNRRISLHLVAVLVFALAQAVAAADNRIALVVGGKAFPDAAPVLCNGTVYTALSVLAPLGAAAKTDEKHKRDGQKVEITPASGRKFTCKARLISGALMLPIEEMAERLGAVAVRDEAAQTLSLRARIEAVEFDGARIRVKTGCPVTYEVAWWKSANKLILDIAGVQMPANQSELNIRNSTAAAIRTGVRDNGETGRIVFDMPQPVEHRVEGPGRTSEIAVLLSPPLTSSESPEQAGPDKPGESAVESKPTPQVPPADVTAIDYTEHGPRRAEVRIKTTAQVTFITYMLRRPDRLIIDLKSARLAKEFGDRQIGHSILQGIRAGQQSGDMVRVVLDLTRVAGFDIRQDQDPTRLTLSLELPRGAGGSLSGKTVVIDPGHGGTDTGARGFNSSLEKDLNLAIALRLHKALGDAGVCSLLTRKSDVYVSLSERSDFARRHSADFFISVHCNSCPKLNTISGTETFYHDSDGNSRALAQCVHSDLVGAAGLFDRGVKSDYWRFPGMGMAVLRYLAPTGMPAILIEAAFINHSGDEAHLNNPKFQQRIAEAIVRGLKAYVEGSPPATEAAAPEPPTVISETTSKAETLSTVGTPEPAPTAEAAKTSKTVPTGPRRPRGGL